MVFYKRSSFLYIRNLFLFYTWDWKKSLSFIHSVSDENISFPRIAKHYFYLIKERTAPYQDFYHPQKLKLRP